MVKRLRASVLPVSLLLILCCGALWAQSAARLNGIVGDSTGASISGAQVKLVNTATGVITDTVSNSSGVYVFPFVLPGSYSLSVTSPGFAVWSKTIDVHANDHLAVNANLDVHAANVSIEVNTSAAVVPTTDSGQRSETLTSQQIQAFSTLGRDAEELLTLLPGITSPGPGSFGGNYGSKFDPHVVSSGNNGIEGFNVNGNRSDANTFKLDGGNMDDLTGNNGSNIYPNTEFISELTVETSNFTADQGGSPVLVTAITKSGTKDFHGEVYWTGRNNKFDANDWSNKFAGVARPKSKFNYPGFSFGGPILLPWTNYNRGKEKKLFFFIGAEFSRQTPDPGTQLADVPSAKMLTGDFTDITGSATCQAFYTAYAADPTTGDPGYLNQPCHITDPATGMFLDQQGGQLTGITANGSGLLNSLMGPGFTGPNYTDPNGIWNYAGHPIYAHNVTQYVSRVDWNPSDKARIFVRLGRQDEKQFSPFSEYSGEGSTWTSNVPDPTPTIQEYHSRSLNISMVNTLSPTMTNEFTFNTNVLRQPNSYQDPSQLSKQKLGVSFNGVFPNDSSASYPIVPQIVPAFGICDSLNTSGCSGGVPGTGRWGASNLVGAGNYYKQTQFEFSDNVTKVVGAHTLKFGALLERARNDQNLSGSALEGQVVTSTWTGGTSGNEYADILTEHFASYTQVNHDLRANLRSSQFEWFGQDSWKVSKKLTVEYGARWTLQGPWYEARSLGTTFDPKAYDAADSANPYNGVRTASCQGAASSLPLCGTIPKTILPYGHPIIQPRLGFSWDTMGNGKAVLRGGVGLYTQRDPTNSGFGAILGPPNLFTASLCCNLTLGQIEASDPGAQGAFTYSQSSAVYNPHDNHVPTVYQYNLTLSSALPRHFFAEVAYVGSQSRHLLVEQNIDSVPYGALWLPGTHLINPIYDGNQGGSEGLAAPYAPFRQISQNSHSGNANYNSLQGTLRRQASHSLDFIASYTYSKALGESDQFQTLLPNPFSNAGSYHVLSFDRTHLFSVGYQYFVPQLARGAISGSKFARGALNGWMFSGISKASSGGPIAVSANVTCRQAIGNTTTDCAPSIWSTSDTWFGTNAWTYAFLPGSQISPPAGIYPDYTCNAKANHRGINTSFINPNCITLPAFGEQGKVNPPYIKTPGVFSFDLALQKSFHMSESRRVDVRVSAFNLFNRAQLNVPNTVANFNWTLPAGATDPSQGTPSLSNDSPGCSGGVGTLGYSCGKTGHREMEATVKFFF
jgi:carboxypeptidase family protein